MNLSLAPQDPVTSGRLDIGAPCPGILVPLGQIPDPAFAGGALGPGIGIEPLDGIIRAPCAGEILAIARTRHAITIRAANGAEILIHVGIDTVSLDGEGFRPLVATGDIVDVLTPLIEADLTAIARHAPSLCTPVIVVNAEEFDVEIASRDRRVEAGAPLMRITRKAEAKADEPADPDAPAAAASLVLEMPDGIHARPAAQIARLAKTHPAAVRIARGETEVNAKSTAGLMGLGAAHGDTIEIRVHGARAEAMLAALTELVRSGAGDRVEPLAEAAANPAPVGPTEPKDEYNGVAASSGIAIGPIHIHRTVAVKVPQRGEAPDVERSRLDEALARIRADIAEEARQARGEHAALLEAHGELADDPDLIDGAREAIAAGASAGAAWQSVTRTQARRLEATGDTRTAERAADLADIETRILRALYGDGDTADAMAVAGAIVVADELLPSEFMRHARSGIAGLCLARGGATSHVAILATAENIPALIGMGPDVLSLDAGTPAMMDTASCRLRLDPPPDEIETVRTRRNRRREAEALAALAATEPARTTDGTRIHVQANLASIDDAASALRNGAEGCGLLRTEFLFTHRRTPPGETEQAEVYAAISQCLKGQPLTVRTLDIGGDKPVPFLDLGEEPNPALGLRGIRTLFARPELMRDQVRALLGVAARRDVQIMLPMVSGPDELVEFRAIARALAREMEIDKLPPIGTMIETPASAVIADQICRHADFVSIGTNDLTQYTLAMDRGHAALAGRMDALHPAVVGLIGRVGEAAKRAGIPASVCGGLASDPVAVPVLIGLGIGKLSVVQSMIAPVKAIVRELDTAHCASIAADLHTLDNALAIRTRIVAEWPQLDRWL